MFFLFISLLRITATTANVQCETPEYESLGMDHTMCKYEENACRAAVRGITEQNQNELVSVHNELRNKVASGKQKAQPCAKNMIEVIWNKQLAEVAQRWADQCKFEHDTIRNTNEFEFVGQNIFRSRSSIDNATLDVREAVTAWFNEVTEPGFDPKNINPFKGSPGAMHYTQVVWANTTAVGCGYTYSEIEEVTDMKYQKIVVCNYGPGGNMVGDPMYKKGKFCSDCEHGCSKKYTALCAPK